MVNKKIHSLTSLDIQGLSSTGEGVAKLDGLTIFVENALPEETIKAKVTEQKKTYAKAELTEILKPSFNRNPPPCSYYLKGCGGCQIMHASYQEQLKMKQTRVFEALKRIGKLSLEVKPTLPSPRQYHYRNKIQLPYRSLKDSSSFGLYSKRSHHLVPINECLIQNKSSNEILKVLSELLANFNILGYNPDTHMGMLKQVLIRSTEQTNQASVTFITTNSQTKQLQTVAKELMKRLPQVVSVWENINPQKNNTILGNKWNHLQGSQAIEEKLLDLRFSLSPAAFFQVNPLQAEVLYSQALELAELTGNEKVIDAFCGVGTLSLVFAKRAGSVIGIECIPEAIQNAVYNASLNKIDNCEFYCRPVELALSYFENADVIILNPPRKGCEEKFLKKLLLSSPKKIIYISCHPETLARDLSICHDIGYQIKTVQPVDMFPQTMHIETIVSLEKK